MLGFNFSRTDPASHERVEVSPQRPPESRREGKAVSFKEWCPKSSEWPVAALSASGSLAGQCTWVFDLIELWGPTTRHGDQTE